MRAELVIRGGTLVDGSGEAPYAGDVALAGGRIVAVGRLDGVDIAGAEQIDAAGCIVTPGFVDIHTHYDGQAIWSDRLTPSSVHGVTTVVVGNCGVGFAPCRKADQDVLIRLMEGVEDIPGVVMAEGLAWNWESFGDYLDALDARPRDIDVAAYVPHSPLRVYVMGQRAIDREPASDEDLTRMRALVRDGIAAGAIGCATSRLFYHRASDGGLIPTYNAGERELEALALGMTDAGGGLLQLVPNLVGGDVAGEIALIGRITERTGVPVTFTSGAGTDPAAVTRPVAAFREAGHDVTAQIFPGRWAWCSASAFRGTRSASAPASRRSRPCQRPSVRSGWVIRRCARASRRGAGHHQVPARTAGTQFRADVSAGRRLRLRARRGLQRGRAGGGGRHAATRLCV